MSRRGSALACVTGRFQPVHFDHVALFATALRDADHLVVAVTNPDPGARHTEDVAAHRHTDEANPFTYYERQLLLRAVLDERAAVVPFDLTRPEHWMHYVPLDAVQYVRALGPWEEEKARRLEAAGYPVVRVPPETATGRTATAVRAALRSGAPWHGDVPAAAAAVLRQLLAARPMALR